MAGNLEIGDGDSDKRYSNEVVDLSLEEILNFYLCFPLPQFFGKNLMCKVEYCMI